MSTVTKTDFSPEENRAFLLMDIRVLRKLSPETTKRLWNRAYGTLRTADLTETLKQALRSRLDDLAAIITKDPGFTHKTPAPVFGRGILGSTVRLVEQLEYMLETIDDILSKDGGNSLDKAVEHCFEAVFQYDKRTGASDDTIPLLDRLSDIRRQINHRRLKGLEDEPRQNPGDD